jgi:translation initiation factor IF-1
MNLIIKRLSSEVETLDGNTLMYVQTEDGTNVRAEICSEGEVSSYVHILKSEYDIKQVIYFDL